MADDDEESGPVVELGEGDPVDGMPLARVSSRQTWGIEKSRLAEREGDTEIRTPDGPQRLGDVLDSIETVYFTRRQDFEDEVTNVIGTGPVPTTENERSDANGDETTGPDDSDDSDSSNGSDGSGEPESDADVESEAEEEPEADAEPASDDALDPDPEGDAEARATSQGEAHAETSSDVADDSNAEGDADEAEDADSDTDDAETDAEDE